MLVSAEQRLECQVCELQRTVVDDVPRLRHQAAGLSCKCVVARARRSECVAMQVLEPKLRLQIVCGERCQGAA